MKHLFVKYLFENMNYYKYILIYSQNIENFKNKI